MRQRRSTEGSRIPGFTVRFGETALEQIKKEARREGLSAGAFIREAAVIRAMLLRARRGGFPDDADLATAIREYLAAERE